MAMLRLISAARTKTKAVGFMLKGVEVEGIAGNCNEIASTWIVDAGVDENFC